MVFSFVLFFDIQFKSIFLLFLFGDEGDKIKCNDLGNYIAFFPTPSTVKIGWHFPSSKQNYKHGIVWIIWLCELYKSVEMKFGIKSMFQLVSKCPRFGSGFNLFRYSQITNKWPDLVIFLSMKYFLSSLYNSLNCLVSW